MKKKVLIGIVALLMAVVFFAGCTVNTNCDECEPEIIYECCDNEAPVIVEYYPNHVLSKYDLGVLDTRLRVRISDFEGDTLKVQFYVRMKGDYGNYTNIMRGWYIILDEVGEPGWFKDDCKMPIFDIPATYPAFKTMEWRVDIMDGHNIVSEVYEINYWS